MDTHLPTPICQGLCYQFYSFQCFYVEKIHFSIIFQETSSFSTLQKRPFLVDLPCPRLRWFGAAAQHGSTAPVGRDGGAVGKISTAGGDFPMKNGYPLVN